MLETKLLEPFLVQKTEDQNREETVKECVNNIRPVDEACGLLEEYKNKSFLQKIKSTLPTCEMGMGLSGATLFGVILKLFFENENISLERLAYATVILLGLITVSLFICYWMFKTNGYNETGLIRNEEENKKRIISLFSALSDKKFEIRGELLETCSKLKLVVEENQYIDGTTSVIKNSSKSLTAYINMTESKEFIIKSIVSVVKESERKFS